MSWTLAGDAIPAPHQKSVKDDIQEVLHRTLNGTYARDFVGSSKKVIAVQWDAISATDYATILGHFEDQRDNGTTKSLVISELGISLSVLISLTPVDYNIPRTYDYFQFGATFIEV